MGQKLNKEQIKTVQQMLNKHYKYNLVVDGDAGPKTMAALGAVPFIPSHWDSDRQLVGFIQHSCMLEGINAGPVDGYWGPQTDFGYESLAQKVNGKEPEVWRDDEGIGAVPQPNTWPIQTQSELEKYYGPVGTNQTSIIVPYPLKIAWNTDQIITKFTCHEKVADSVVRILTRVKDHYGDKIEELGLDLWGGCLNVRKMRGGTKYSTHSWGIAIDWDPAHNRLRAHHTSARLAKPIYTQWWKLWEEEGWVSLGRTRDYDWMHVQAAKVR